MRVVILDSAEAVSHFAADRVIEAVHERVSQSGRVVLGMATGGTPLGLYRELRERHRAGKVSFQHATTFNLDEYVGIAPEDPRSYHAYMRVNLFDHVDIDRANTYLPRADRVDLKLEAAEYESQIVRACGIDLQILGIGANGHIGFNEVGSSFGSRTRVVTLTRQTRQDNARYFNSIDEVPKSAVTMGIATILQAKQIMLLANGSSKAAAIHGCIEGPQTVSLPASALQWHPNVTIVIDREAASRLAYCDYYNDSEANRR